MRTRSGDAKGVLKLYQCTKRGFTREEKDRQRKREGKDAERKRLLGGRTGEENCKQRVEGMPR